MLGRRLTTVATGRWGRAPRRFSSSMSQTPMEDTIRDKVGIPFSTSLAFTFIITPSSSQTSLNSPFPGSFG